MTNNSGNTLNVEALYSEIENANITSSNYDDWNSKIKMMSNMSDVQAQNDLNKLSEAMDDFNELKGQQHVKNSLSQDIVPKKLYEFMATAHNCYKTLYQWAELEKSILRIMVSKQNKVLEGFDALSLKKDLLSEFKESDKQKLDMMKEVLNNQMKMIEDKVVSQNQNVIERFDNLNKYTITALESVIDKTNKTNMAIVDKVGVNLASKIKIDMELLTEEILKKLPGNDIANKMQSMYIPEVVRAKPEPKPQIMRETSVQLDDVQSQKLEETRDMRERENQETQKSNNKQSDNSDIVNSKRFKSEEDDLEAELDNIDIFG